MKLTQLLENVDCQEILGRLDKEIGTISQDSRDEKFKDGLYFAIVGTQVDGHDFIDDVIEKGAVVIVCEFLPADIDTDVTYILVKNSKKIMGQISSIFFNNPSNDLQVIAVTGTNGKTTVATYMAQALQELGEKVLLLSTAGDYFNGEKINIDRKAPSSLEIIELHKIIRFYFNKGATYVCLEATSQGLDQERLSGLDIDVAIFTNIGQDHLDYHKTIENYRASKKLLFDNLKDTAIAVSNFDDDFGKDILVNTKAGIISYGSESSHDYSFRVREVVLGSIQSDFNDQIVTLPVIGMFNVYNVLSVYATLLELQYDVHAVVNALEKLKGVPGRMQRIDNPHGVLALVDYAHEPMALENVLETLQELPHNNIITIIGCGGDRDRLKRAPMAAVTQQMSNHSIYTADNPRTESVDRIFEDMKKGIDTTKNNYEFINDREKAIEQAVKKSRNGDIILIAGKGHEDYQIIGVDKKHFDDREIVEKYFKKNNTI